MIPRLSEAGRDYLAACAAKGLSEATIAGYRGILNLLVRQLGDLYLDQIRPADLRTYYARISKQKSRYQDHPVRAEKPGGLSSESIRQRAVVIGMFLGWCWREYRLDPAISPLLNVERPVYRRPEERIKAVSDGDALALLAACGSDAIGLRDYAALQFLLNTGCRAGGLVGLRRADLHLERCQATLTEKGARSRAVYFPVETAEAIRRWLAVAPASDQVFCAVGPFREGDPLLPTGLHAILRKLKQRAGVTGPVNPHAFRHRFAIKWLMAGGDVFSLSRILGHSSLQVTKIYTESITKEQLAEVYGAVSQLMQIKE